MPTSTHSKYRTYQSRNPRTTPIFKITQDHLTAFKTVKPNLPGHVYQTLDALLTCGLPEWGFMRLKCQACTFENIVAFSCKRRGPCSSCGTKRMVEAAAHMTDNVLPEARYRQVVVTLPFPLRYWVATNRDLMNRVHAIIIKTLHRKLRSKGEEIGIKDPIVGSVTYMQRFGSGLQGSSSDLGNLIAPGFGYNNECAIKKSRLCYMQNGFSIHAARVINPKDRRGLEKLISYMARPALSQDKLSYDGQTVTYRLKSPWSDGRTELCFKPLAFLSRLAALIPPPRSHSARHSGILAPAHKLRRLIVLDPNKKKVFQPGPPRTGPKLVKNTEWAKCLARVFEIDVGKCRHCEADMLIVSFLFDGLEIARYLKHCGLLSTGPPTVDPAADPSPLILDPIHD